MEKPKEKTDYASIKSAKRTLELFELFSELRRPARVTELYKSLELPQSSTSKLLRTFSKLGYLHYDPEARTFYPTLRVTLLGSWLHDQWFGSGKLLRTVEALREELGTSVLLGVQNDIYVLYMLALEALQHPRPPLSVGTLRPICRAAVGKALLLSKSDHEIELLIRRINAEENDTAQHIEPQGFLADIRQSRERGYTLSNGSVIPGVGVVATTLPKLPGQPLMALGVGAKLDWLTPNLPMVLTALRDRVNELGNVDG